MEYVKHRFLKENSIESRLYQEQILDTATKKNLLVVLPTGLGKTALAALVAAHRLEKFPDAQILFLAPTRPLAAQHKKTFESFFALPAQDFYVLTGVISPEKRKLQYDRKIIFSTPQVIENDIKSGVLSLNNFSLVIFDESHRAVGDYAYPFIAKEYQKTAANSLILALTASPGGTYEKIQTICKNLGVQAVEIRTEKDEDVAPYMKEVNVEWVFVELPQQFKEIQALLKKFLETKAQKLVEWHLLEPNRLGKGKLIELQKRLQVMIKRENAGYAFFALSAVAELLKVEHALEMLESQG
ncbi:MAG: DEAD/DEAH box helicase family protein, partial [Candidatus Aenigmatarchaeota archaeon]